MTPRPVNIRVPAAARSVIFHGMNVIGTCTFATARATSSPVAAA